VVEAYTAMMDRGTAGATYNVCRGEAVSIQAILDGLLDLALGVRESALRLGGEAAVVGSVGAGGGLVGVVDGVRGHGMTPKGEGPRR
jgi:hypothetical protein